MRTVKRHAEALNVGKVASLEAVRSAYTKEKRHWLTEFEKTGNRSRIKQHRKVRDEALRAEYTSASGLPARLWKLALVEAAETWDKYWQALFVEIRSRAGRRNLFDDAERHYLNRILKDYDAFFAALSGAAPDFPKVETEQRRRVVRWLGRAVSRLRGKAPSVKRQRSFALDSCCYSVFENKGRQYLKIMTLERGQRTVLPLKGSAAIQGNIRVVLTRCGVEVHVPQALRSSKAESGVIEAIDFGYTEAFTDTEGKDYGTELGRIMTQASNDRHHSGKARNKLRALSEKYAASSNQKLQRKACRIRKHNLGKQKWQRREDRARSSLECQINAGLNQLLREKRPSVLVTEHLRHAFTYDKPKSWNRKLSAWVRGVLQDRVEFKGLVEGFRHETVNPAYGSQTCPKCGDVDKDNRSGDKFLCQHCGHADHADKVAAINLLSRLGDPEITRYTPYREVKTILEGRFHRRLEAGGLAPDPATVPGRTPDTEPSEPRRKATRKRQREGCKPNAPVGHSESETSEYVRLHI